MLGRMVWHGLHGARGRRVERVRSRRGRKVSMAPSVTITVSVVGVSKNRMTRRLLDDLHHHDSLPWTKQFLDRWASQLFVCFDKEYFDAFPRALSNCERKRSLAVAVV